MKFDITTFVDDLKVAADLGAKVEAYGFDGLWTAEAAHNPFLPLAVMGMTTQKIALGTQIAVAFARSPMTTAQMGWDLQSQTDGRFILGLGTQVKAHIERRFSMPWSAPIPRLREYIESLRAIWQSWQTGERLRYKGDFYSFTLMTPFFSPQPMQYHDIPIYVAGVNEKICQLAGEICQGLHAHGFHTAKYLKEVVLKNVETGLQAGNRSRDNFELVVPIFTVTGETDEEFQKNISETKGRIAFYAGTPTYRVVLEQHGWEAAGEKLSEMARFGKWDEMWKEISDDMLHEIAVVAAPDEIASKIKERYTGLADRVCFGWEIDKANSDTVLEALSKIGAQL
jgi:probable F420-dependent oxidoreductase